MKTLVINQQLVDASAVSGLTDVCPFSAISCDEGILSIGAGCTMCGLCVKNGPEGVFSWVEKAGPADPEKLAADKSIWHGVAVYAEQLNGRLHNVAGELLGKARQMAAGQPVHALLIGSGMGEAADKLLMYGADYVYVYDDPGSRSLIWSLMPMCFRIL
jgi:electron transfer flavoprotein alpha subunit